MCAEKRARPKQVEFHMWATLHVLRDKAEERADVHARQATRDEADIRARNGLVCLLNQRPLVQAERHYECLEELPPAERREQRDNDVTEDRVREQVRHRQRAVRVHDVVDALEREEERSDLIQRAYRFRSQES